MSRSNQGSPSTCLATEMTAITASHICWSADEIEMKAFVAAVEKTMAMSVWIGAENEFTGLCCVETGYQGCDIMHEYSAGEVSVSVSGQNRMCMYKPRCIHILMQPW